MQDAKGGSVEELLTLFPQPETVTQGDVKVLIPVLNIGQIAKILKIVGPIFSSANPEKQWQELIAENAEQIAPVLAVALSKPIAYIEAMPGDLAAHAMLKLYKVNADFFKSRILPLIAGFQSEVGATGQTQ